MRSACCEMQAAKRHAPQVPPAPSQTTQIRYATACELLHAPLVTKHTDNNRMKITGWQTRRHGGRCARLPGKWGCVSGTPSVETGRGGRQAHAGSGLYIQAAFKLKSAMLAHAGLQMAPGNHAGHEEVLGAWGTSLLCTQTIWEGAGRHLKPCTLPQQSLFVGGSHQTHVAVDPRTRSEPRPASAALKWR